MADPVPPVDLVPYTRTPQPTNPKSIPTYFDQELRKLQSAISSIEAAIKQLQSLTSGLTS